MKNLMATTTAALAVSAALMPASAVAQSPGAQLPGAWQFQATIYGYFPKLDIKAGLPNGATVDQSIDANTLIDHLKMVFMGTFEAQKGDWGAFTDIIYMNVGGAQGKVNDFTLGSTPIPAGVSVNASADVKAVVWTLAGTYRALTGPDGTLDVLLGARLLDVTSNQTYTLAGNVGPIPPQQRTGSGEIKASNWDAIVGVKGRVALGADRKWFVPYYLDVGTGESKLTWQAMSGVGYAFSWGDIVATWRYMDWENKSGKPLLDLSLNGPALAATFRW
ncbi:MAG: hypothetical protein ACREUW_01585 [Burkholderiales bacterium]